MEIIRWTYRHRGRVSSCRATFDWCSVLIRDFVVGQFETSVRRVSICFPSSNKNLLGAGKLNFCFNPFLICVQVGVTLTVKLSLEGGIIEVGVDFCEGRAWTGQFPRARAMYPHLRLVPLWYCLHAHYAFMVALGYSYYHKVLPVHPTKTCTGSGGVTLLILNLGNGWEVSVRNHAPDALPPEKIKVPGTR